MQLISNATTPEEMRDQIADYLASQADNFASRKNAEPSKTVCAQYEAIRNALMVVAEMVKHIAITQNVREG